MYEVQKWALGVTRFRFGAMVRLDRMRLMRGSDKTGTLDQNARGHNSCSPSEADGLESSVFSRLDDWE